MLPTSFAGNAALSCPVAICIGTAPNPFFTNGMCIMVQVELIEGRGKVVDAHTVDVSVPELIY